MKIVIVGDGKVGYSLARQLSKEDHDIVVIDSNPEVLEELLETLDVMTVIGNGATLEVQREANVAVSDLLIAATSSDETNLLCCILAKKLGCRHTISRVRNSAYTQQLQFLRDELGLSLTINPELTAAREIFRLTQYPSFLKRDVFAKGRVELVEIKLSSDNKLVGKRLDGLFDSRLKALVCAVERGDTVTIPKGGFVFQEGDNIIVAAKNSDLAKLIKQLDIAKSKIKNVMIIGGSRISVYCTDLLLKAGVNVKIIEQDAEKCIELAERLPDAIIIHGDGTRQDLLIEEGIRHTDAVISLTNIDEENLIISLFADYLNVSKTITKINRLEYRQLFNDKGIDSIICPKELTTNDIVRYVRAMNNTTGGSVVALHRIFDGKAEALEFIVQPTTLHREVPFSKISIKKNILIASLNRNGNIIIPNGNDCLMTGDTAIIVTTSDRTIENLNDIFTDGENR